MKKIKQLSLMLFISVGLFSCEAEKVDEIVKDEFLQGKQILRFDLDGVTRTTDDVNVSAVGSEVVLTATFNDDISEFNNQTFTITFDKLATGSYVAFSGVSMDPDSDPTMGFATATFKHHNVNWSYSTNNLEFDINNPFVNTGTLTILSINDKAKYFEGKFNFDLYLPVSSNPGNLLPPVKITNGYFQYVKYN